MTRQTILRTIFAVIATALSVTGASALKFADESLNYKVQYKWGLVQKQAGTVNISLRNRGNEYTARLTARSDPWADRFFKVRDTLNARMSREPFAPLFYEKISNEGGDHKHDIIRYSRQGAKTIGECTRLVMKKGEEPRNEKRTLENYGTVVDMLSVFYYMRALPFDKWTSGQVTSINIFSDKRRELLTIKYLGTAKIDIDKKTYSCYHINFRFTSESGKKTSDDIDAWITTDAARIPVKLEGKLPVGKVRCFYAG